jgi:hypothetical protein
MISLSPVISFSIVVACMTTVTPEVAQATARMSPNGAISGRVVHTDGSPLRGGAVQAVRLDASGRPTLAGGGSSLTDERGSFRIAGLPSGPYYVTALEPMPEHVAAGASDPRALATFYPAAIDPADAQVVVVEPGLERQGIDIRFLAQRGVQVSGIVTLPDKKLLRTGAVVLIRQNVAGIPIGAAATGRMYPDGAYFFVDVLPGRYEVRALVQSGKNKDWYTGSVIVEVGTHPVNHSVIRLVKKD